MNIHYYSPEIDLTQFSDAELISFIEEIISEAMIENSVYYDFNDIENATAELLPTFSQLANNSRFNHLKYNVQELVEFFTYLTVKLG